MILPKKENENPSKPKLSKESLNKIHNSENVSQLYSNIYFYYLLVLLIYFVNRGLKKIVLNLK